MYSTDRLLLHVTTTTNNKFTGFQQLYDLAHDLNELGYD